MTDSRSAPGLLGEYIILIVGDEILEGRRIDRHISFLARTFAPLGLRCIRAEVVADRYEWLKRSLTRALDETPLVLVTGGLGPTLDDITRDVISDATGIGLAENNDALEMIRDRFRQMGRTMGDNNRVQAKVPVQGGFYPNPNGTAPGLIFDDSEHLVLALPGPPRELEPMVRDQVIPHIQRRFQLGPPWHSHCLRMCCIGESSVDQIFRDELGGVADLKLSSLAQLGTLDFTLSLPGTDDNKVRLNQYIDTMRTRLRDYIFTEDDRSLPAVLGDMLKEKGLTLALAESCTGGMLGSMITDVPGSSVYFSGGAVTYSNEIKQRLLGIDPAIIETHGAVSREIAETMALGACDRFESNWAVSITGVAGPDGGTPDKPVGTVWIAAAERNGQPHAFRVQIAGNRLSIRQRSCIYALDQLRRLLSGLPPHS